MRTIMMFSRRSSSNGKIRVLLAFVRQYFRPSFKVNLTDNNVEKFEVNGFLLFFAIVVK